MRVFWDLVPWWRQYKPLKRRSTPTRLHDTTSQKTLIFILDAMRTWNLEQSAWCSLTHAHCSYHVYNGKIFWTAVLSRACTECVVQTYLLSGYHSVRSQDKWCGPSWALYIGHFMQISGQEIHAFCSHWKRSEARRKTVLPSDKTDAKLFKIFLHIRKMINSR
jgi:hypothetical protein